MAGFTSLQEIPTRSRGCCPPDVATYLQIPAEEPQGQLIVVGSQVYGERQTCSTRGPKLGRLVWAFSSVGARHIGVGSPGLQGSLRATLPSLALGTAMLN